MSSLPSRRAPRHFVTRVTISCCTLMVMLLPHSGWALTFGANIHVAQRYQPQDDAALEAALVAHPVPWAREEFYWQGMEPSQGTFQWAATDRAVALYRRQGMKVLGLLAYSASWATTNTSATNANDRIFAPPQLDAWEAFITAVVTRYRDDVDAWEVWNEPDLPGFFRTPAGAAAYVPLLRRAYTTIKRIDPSSTVVSAGTAGVNTAFIRKMYQHGARGYVDAIGVHPYRILGSSFANAPEHSAFGMQTLQADLAALRAVLAKYDPGRPIWATEVGWPTHSKGVTLTQQAAYLERAAYTMLAYGVDVAFWYGFRDDGVADEQEQSFGMLRNDFSPKPVAATLARLNRDLLDTTFVRWENLVAPSRIAQQDRSGWAVERWDRGRMVRRTGVAARAITATPTGEKAVPIAYDFTGGSGSRFSYLTGPFTRTYASTFELWYLGDGSMHDLRLRVADAQGETFQLTLGPIGSGWQRAYVDLRTVSNRLSSWGARANGKIEKPLTILGVIVDGSTNRGLRTRGTVQLGSVRSLVAPLATAVRVQQAGRVRRVLWADSTSTVSVRTPVQRPLTLTQNDAVSTVTPVAGMLRLTLSHTPLTLE